jgi:hypothetical protein
VRLFKSIGDLRLLPKGVVPGFGKKTASSALGGLHFNSRRRAPFHFKPLLLHTHSGHATEVRYAAKDTIRDPRPRRN